MESFEEIKHTIDQLAISEDTKSALNSAFHKLKKELKVKEFMCSRIEEEKSISNRFLNKTILHLQEKQQEVAEANQLLQQQKEEIESKNLELIFQKKLVDQQSFMLEEKLKELENSYKELEQFSYIASHDLKSPLRTIGTFSQLLQKRLKGQLGEEAEEYIEFIVKGTRQMSQVIDDLLEYSRVGVKNDDFQILDIQEVLDLVKFNLTRDIEVANVTLEIDKMPSSILANRSSMIQIFQNLIANAIKFRSDKAPLIQVRTSECNDFHHFVVIDNGVGMDEAYQKKAFEPFQRLNNQEREGTGMGLAICRKIAQLHEGDIRFESQKGEGTSFFFKIAKKISSQKKVNKILVESSN